MTDAQIEPDTDPRLEHAQRRRTANRDRKIAAFAVTAAISLAACSGPGGTPRGENGTTIGPAEAPETTAEEPEVDYVIDLNTGARTPLPEAIIRSLGETAKGRCAESQYAASPDGSLLAYVGTGDEGTPQIFHAGIDGTGVRQVTHDPTGAASPAWSPDGTTIAYVGGSRDPRDLFVLDVARGESTQIADGVALPYSGLQFTPDGSSLVYTGGSFSVPELRTVQVAGGQSTILFGRGRGGMADAGSGSLSPDGSLVTMMGSEIGGPGAIRFVANADGTELRHIAGRASNPAGTWSPDGSRIVCRASDENGGIIVVDIATGDTSPVAEGSDAIWLDRHTLLVES